MAKFLVLDQISPTLAPLALLRLRPSVNGDCERAGSSTSDRWVGEEGVSGYGAFRRLPHNLPRSLRSAGGGEHGGPRNGAGGGPRGRPPDPESSGRGSIRFVLLLVVLQEWILCDPIRSRPWVNKYLWESDVIGCCPNKMVFSKLI